MEKPQFRCRIYACYYVFVQWRCSIIFHIQRFNFLNVLIFVHSILIPNLTKKAKIILSLEFFSYILLNEPNFRMTNLFNPIHLISFAGARGNASQVHYLVGMRELMSDPQGQIICFPFQRSLCEELSFNRI